MRPQDYRVLNTCSSCKHAFVKLEYDDTPEYYCHLDKSVRPLCGSVLMSESHSPDEIPETDEEMKKHKETFSKNRKAWRAWSEKNLVREEGVCSKWQPTLPTEEEG